MCRREHGNHVRVDGIVCVGVKPHSDMPDYAIQKLLLATSHLSCPTQPLDSRCIA